MSVSVPLVQDKITLKKARARLYNGIVDHDNEKVRKAIAEIQTLGGDLNQPWSSPADGTDDPRPPVVLAAYMHNLEAMRLLLNTDSINLKFESRGKTPVMLDVCRTGNEKVVAMLLKIGGSLKVQASYNSFPFDAAFFASMKFHYSVIFHSDCDLRKKLIDWWQGGEFTPDAPLRARWPGAIPLVALLLKHGANPAIEDTSGISPLKVVRDPTCLLKNAQTLMTVELPGVVKFISHNEGILTFKVILKDRSTKRKLEIMVDVDYNMKLPRDVDASLSQEILDIINDPKVGRTMKGLIEHFAPKDREIKEIAEARASGGVVGLEQRMEELEREQREHSKRQLDDQHVIAFARDQKLRKEKIEAMKEHENPSVRKFFDEFSKLSDKLFHQCKLHLDGLDPTKHKKYDKAGIAVDVIGFVASFAPPPFNSVVDVVKALGHKYLDREKYKARARVGELIERDHGSMCDDFAQELAKKFEGALTKMTPEQAKDLADHAAGAMLALMCANGSKEDEIVLDRSESSFRELQEKMLQAVIAPTKASAKFHKKLKEYAEGEALPAPKKLPQEAPTSLLSYLPSFGRSKSPAPSSSPLSPASAPLVSLLASAPSVRPKSPGPSPSPSVPSALPLASMPSDQRPPLPALPRPAPRPIPVS